MCFMVPWPENLYVRVVDFNVVEGSTFSSLLSLYLVRYSQPTTDRSIAERPRVPAHNIMADLSTAAGIGRQHEHSKHVGVDLSSTSMGRQDGIIGKTVSCTSTKSKYDHEVDNIGGEIDREELISLKVKLAELQTELMIEQNVSKKEKETVASLMEDNASLKRQTSFLEEKVSRLEKRSDEMVSRITLLVCEIDRLREISGRHSNIQNDSIMSSALRGKIEQVMVALKTISGEMVDHHPPDASSSSAQQPMVNVFKTYAPKRASTNDGLATKHTEETDKAGTLKKTVTRRSSDPTTNEQSGARWYMRRASLPENGSSYSLHGMFRAFSKDEEEPLPPTHRKKQQQEPTQRRQRKIVVFKNSFRSELSSSESPTLQRRNTYDNNRVHLKNQNTVFFPFDSFTEADAEKLRLSEKTAELTEFDDSCSFQGGFEAASSEEICKYSAKYVNEKEGL